MIPLRPSRLKFQERWPLYIIVHHTHCKYPEFHTVSKDTDAYQTTKLVKYAFRTYQEDLEYHYIVEKNNNEVAISVGKPLFTVSKFPDIPDEFNNNAIHIAILGNYDLDFPDVFLYNSMVYRLLLPFARVFKIKEKDIFFHKELSLDVKQTCPGEFSKKVFLDRKFRTMRGRNIPVRFRGK